MTDMLNENATGADRGIFPVQPLNHTEGRMLILRAFAPADKGGLGGTKVGVLTNTDEASQTMLEGIKAEAKDLSGAQKDAIVYQNVTSTDFSAAINAFKAAGVPIIEATTPIIPIYTYEPERTLIVAKRLYEEGLYVNPVLPPAAPAGGCLLRTSYMASLTYELIDEALDIIESAIKS